jgi:hypothetical protein
VHYRGTHSGTGYPLYKPHPEIFTEYVIGKMANRAPKAPCLL